MNLDVFSIGLAASDLEASKAMAGLGARAPGRDRGELPVVG
jgi:hypothetical protein